MRLHVLEFSSLSLLLLAACSHNPPPAPALPPLPVAPDSVVWNGDADLAPVLRKGQLTPFVLAGAERVEQRLGPDEFADRLSIVAEDTVNPWIVRVNALKLLATRGALEQLPVFNEALHDPLEIIRIAAVNDMREYMGVQPAAATRFLVVALNDPSSRVQAGALQLLGDRDLDALRGYYNRTTNPELRTIALDIIRTAEERGAPLVPKDSSGTLEREAASGVTVTFKPTERWRDWDAAVGEVYVKLPGKKAELVASGVEAVANVVPAFVTSDGKNLVYEVNREVHVRDLATGTDRKLADGIAPRILPVSNDVIYMVEVKGKRTITPNSVGMKFDVMRIPLAGGTATSLGQINDIALNELHGNYATVRWARISETEGNFDLVGDRIEPFKLPSPFGS